MLEKFLPKNRHKEIAKAATINHSHIPEMKLIANEALEALSNLGYSIERMWATNSGKSISIITNKPRVFIDMSPGLRSGKISLDKDYTDKERKKLRKIRKDESLSDEEIEEKMAQSGVQHFLSPQEEEQILNKLQEYGFKITNRTTDKHHHWSHFNFVPPQEVLTGMTIDEESPNESKETSSGNEKVLKIIEYVRKMVKRKDKS